MVTRTVFGIEDELLFLTPYPRSKPAYRDSLTLACDISNATRNLKYTEFSNTIHQEIQLRDGNDCYADRYFYNLGNGESGVFRRNYVNDELTMIPYSPTKPIISNDARQIEMITGDGNHYYFKWNLFDVWYLTKIVSNNKTDSVLFYSHIESYSRITSNDIGISGGTEAYLAYDDHCGAWLVQRPRDDRKDILYNYPPSRREAIVIFDSIASTSTAVKFIYDTNRRDCQYEGDAPKSQLKKVLVYSQKPRNLIREISLFQSYFGSTQYNYRLRLDSILIGNSDKERYAFRYNTTMLPDYPDAARFTASDPSISTFYQEDHWGYHNIYGNRTTLPWPYFPDGANKTPTPGAMNACSLEEIQFPTGGKTIFEFEPHQLAQAKEGVTSREGHIGGLRVKKISSYFDDKEKPLIKEYQYENLPVYFAGSDLYNYTENAINTFTAGSLSGCDFLQYTTSTITVSTPIQPLIGDDNHPVVYPSVTEFIGDPTTNHIKTVYTFEPPAIDPNVNFEVADNDYMYLHRFQFDRGVYHSIPLTKTEYKYENGQYRTVRMTVNAIDTYKGGRIQTGINLASTHHYKDFTPPGDEAGGFAFYLVRRPTEYLTSLVYSNTWAYTGVRLPSRTDVYDYINSTDQVKTTSIFTYNDLLQISSTSTIGSSGHTSGTTKKYPYDFKEVEPYKTMTARNNLQPVIEQTDYLDSNAQKSVKTNFQTWNVNLIAPSIVEEKLTTSYQPRIVFNGYDDRGNILSVSKDNTSNKRYLWGYNKMYPIAEIICPDAEQPFAYSSFEDVHINQPGRWTINGSNQSVADASAPTGKKCFNLNIGSLSVTGLSQSNTYILSYWYKGGAPVFSSGTFSDLSVSPVLDGWTRVSQKVKGITSLQISGSSYIDEVRIFPIGMTITTYTYDPLIGITSSTDTNGLTTYFEYDSLNRLKTIKDNKKNIVKSYIYNYKK